VTGLTSFGAYLGLTRRPSTRKRGDNENVIRIQLNAQNLDSGERSGFVFDEVEDGIRRTIFKGIMKCCSARRRCTFMRLALV